MYRPIVPVYTRFLDRSISAFQSISRNSEGHVESVQPIKCMIFILICNNLFYYVLIREISDIISIMLDIIRIIYDIIRIMLDIIRIISVIISIIVDIFRAWKY